MLCRRKFKMWSEPTTHSKEEHGEQKEFKCKYAGRGKIQQADIESIWSATRRISLSLNVIFAEESFLISVT